MSDAGDDWLDSKRLIGPHPFGHQPGALLEVAGNGPAFEARLMRWCAAVDELAAQLGWPAAEPTPHRHAGGAMLVMQAPEDVLFAATEVSEAAWCRSVAADRQDDDDLARLASLRDEEADPAGLALVAAARGRGIPAFIDEHGTQVGLGSRGRHFAPGEAPTETEVPWPELGRIPVALVTGTNGKTTTTRLLAAMARAAGHGAGLASTDGAWVGERVVDEGDVSGPGGARRVLQQPEVTLAVLETARGGLLRRGLAVTEADVAIVTNVSADHLGDGGVDTVDRLAEVKFLVTRVLGSKGVAVLNADDARCRAHGRTLPGPVSWFSLAAPPDACEGAWCWSDGERLRYRTETGEVHALVRLAEIPLTLGGRAAYNIANAAAATAAAVALGCPFEAIGTALTSFASEPEDNAGRGTLLHVDGVRVLVDFGHNPAGVRAVLNLFPATERGHLHVLLGQAGDRPDKAIQDLARAAFEGGGDRFVLKELGAYRRGRAPGEVAGLIRETLSRLGVAESHIKHVETEVEAVEAALAQASPGDVVAAFVQSEYDEVVAALRARS